jgi:hypothetical protein
VIAAAVEMAQSALTASKEALGIASPSKKFAQLGGYSADGLAVGFEDEAASAFKQIQRITDEQAAKLTAPAYAARDAMQGSLAEQFTVSDRKRGVAASEGAPSSAQSGEVIHKVVVGLEPSPSGLARELNPYIKSENTRTGASFKR